MPTELKKPVIRRSTEVYDHRKRRIIVALLPGDVISMREERTRTSFSAPLRRVFQQLITWNVESTRPRKRTLVKRGKLA